MNYKNAGSSFTKALNSLKRLMRRNYSIINQRFGNYKQAMKIEEFRSKILK